MSDFGAIISIRKKDAAAFSEAEFQEIERITQAYKESCSHKNSMAKPYLFDVGKTTILGKSDFFEVNILLSDYWGDAKMFNWHAEIDEKDAKIIAGELTPLLPENYALKSAFERW
ncbi:MAG: hypothetical protein ACO1N0_19330 [Fluviicola sp.]